MLSLAEILGSSLIDAPTLETAEHHSRYWSDEEMLNLAFDAGFDSLQAITIVCIALAESGGFDGATGYNDATPGCPDGSRDRGILQINDCYHPEVSDACAYDARCAFQEAYRISYYGLEFGEWTTYAWGLHLDYAERVTAAYHRKVDEEWETDP